MNAPFTLTWAHVEDISGGRDGEFDAPCPICGPERSTAAHRAARTCRVWRAAEFASFHCKHCGAKGPVFSDERRPRLVRTFTRPVVPAAKLAEARAEQVRRAAFAEFLFCSAGPLPGTLAADYLASRGLGSGAADLRFNPRAPWSYAGGRTGPAMIAAFRDPAGLVVAVQVTHLGRDARKLRRTTFGRLAEGGAVRLRPAGDVLAVSEGVETAMSFAALEGVPTWATLGTAGLQAFRPPAGVQRLVIAADNDRSGAGLAAARACAARVCKRCDVDIAMPPATSADFNDVLLRRDE